MQQPPLLQPERLLQDALEFNRKIVKGFHTLSKVGDVSVGYSEKEAVYQEDKMVLYHFKPKVDNPHEVPVLIVYALVNRPYMMDLQEDRSIIRGFLEQGLDVYLVDWGYPDGADRFLELEDYINGYIHDCIDFIRKQHSIDRVNLLGVCQGGTFSLCYSSLHPDRIKNLITMVTPVDFKTVENVLSAWTQNLDVDLLVDTVGNIPGELLNWSYLSLKPLRLTNQKYVDMADILDDQEKLKSFMRMEKWIFDSPDQTGETFRQFTKYFYQQNCFVNGGLKLGGKEVDLKNIKVPVLNIYATQDHLVPPSASVALKELIGTADYSEFGFDAGHIGIYVSGRAQKEIPGTIANWLKERAR